MAFLCTVALTGICFIWSKCFFVQWPCIFSIKLLLYTGSLRIAILLFMPRTKNRHNANTYAVLNTFIQEFSDLACCKNEQVWTSKFELCLKLVNCHTPGFFFFFAKILHNLTTLLKQFYLETTAIRNLNSVFIAHLTSYLYKQLDT